MKINCFILSACTAIGAALLPCSHSHALLVTTHSFESSPNEDTNTVAATGGTPYILGSSTFGATDGTNALSITRPISGAFFGMRIDIVDPADQAAFKLAYATGGSLLFDISTNDSSFSNVNFSQLNLNLIIENGQSGNAGAPGDEANLFTLGHRDAANPTGIEKTSTIEVPLSGFGHSAQEVADSSFLFFQFSHNHNGDGSSTIYMDNVRISAVPEPSGILLGGICSVGLLALRTSRRRQRSGADA